MSVPEVTVYEIELNVNTVKYDFENMPLYALPTYASKGWFYLERRFTLGELSGTELL